MLRPIKPSYDQVADQLAELISRGVFVPGSRLPDEAQLAAMFGVGRSTVREALRILSARGLVAVMRGSKGGAYVLRQGIEGIAEYLDAVLPLIIGQRLVTVEQLLEARETLEVPAAYRAAKRRNDDHLAQLERCLSPPDLLPPQEVYENNFRFHLLILEAAGNPLLKAVTWPLFEVLRNRYLRDRAPRGFWDQVLDDHRTILEALRAADSEGAAEAMRQHMGRLRPVYSQLSREVDLSESALRLEERG